MILPKLNKAIILLLVISMLNLSAFADNKKDTVVLLHGLARSKQSMKKLEKYFSKQGYVVINVNYPSRKFTIEQLVDKIDGQITPQISKVTSKVHFITHSMGGIIVRLYLKKKPLKQLGRVVMLSPPNKGSEIVDRMKDNFFFKMLNGPAGQQLGTNSKSIPNTLGPVNFELGIITGNKSFNPFFSKWLKGKDDGKVSVESAKLIGMTDFLVVPHSHTFIMNSKKVHAQTAYFLKNGKFNREKQ